MMVQIINQKVVISGSGNARYNDDVYINGNVTVSGSGDIYFQSAFINGKITISGTGNISARGTVIAQKLTISGAGDARGNFILTEKCTLSGVGSIYGKISTPKIAVSCTSDYPKYQIPFHQRADAMYASVVSAIERGISPSILTDLFNQPFENLAAGEWNFRQMQTTSVKPSREGRMVGDQEMGFHEKTIPELLETGNKLVERGQYAEAIQCYDRVLEIDPNYANAWNNKGLALDNLRRYNEAIACYDRALEIDPNHATTWSNKGNTLHSLGRSAEAIACYDRALEIDPNHADAWNNKGTTLGFLGNHAEALTCFNQALEIDPNDLLAKENREIALKKIAENERESKAAPPRSGERTHASPPPGQPAITVERTVYDPLTQGFVVSTARPLANVKTWIGRHDPASYWLVVCIHNHSDRTIEEWGIELDSSSSLKILDAAIEGVDGTVSLHTTHPKPWLVRSMLGVSHHRGITIPRNGSRRVYFRLGSESCGVSHTIQGTFIAEHTKAAIRAKQFHHSCDVATLGEVMKEDPNMAEHYLYCHLPRYINASKQMIDIVQCRPRGEIEALPGKLKNLIGALETAGASPKVIAPFKDLTALDLRDGMGGQNTLQLLADETEKLVPHTLQMWMNEALKDSGGHREVLPG